MDLMIEELQRINEMNITMGFSINGKIFKVEKGFDNTMVCFEGKEDFLTYRITRRLNFGDQKLYHINFSFNNVYLLASGLNAKYSLNDENTHIYLENNCYRVENNKKGYYIDFDCGIKPLNFYEKKDIKDSKIKKDKKLIKLVNEKYNHYTRMYSQYYEKIKNKKAVEQQIKSFVEGCFDENYVFEDVEGYIDLKEFFILCIKKESCFYYVKKEATLENFCSSYAKKLPKSITKEEINEVFQEKLKYYIENEQEGYLIEEVFESMAVVEEQEELNRFYNKVFLELKVISNRKKTDKIKEKYFRTLKEDKEFLGSLKYFQHFKRQVRHFFRSTEIVSEEIFARELENFLYSYKEYEKFYDGFYNQFKSTLFVFELSSELEEKFIKYENSDCELSEDEKIYYEYIYSRIKDDYYRAIYIKNTKKLKPTFKYFSNFANWVKNFFAWMLDNNIIEKNGKRINDDNIKLLQNIPISLRQFDRNS